MIDTLADWRADARWCEDQIDDFARGKVMTKAEFTSHLATALKPHCADCAGAAAALADACEAKPGVKEAIDWGTLFKILMTILPIILPYLKPTS